MIVYNDTLFVWSGITGMSRYTRSEESPAWRRASFAVSDVTAFLLTHERAKICQKNMT